jgi:hypothetical protein
MNLSTWVSVFGVLASGLSLVLGVLQWRTLRRQRLAQGSESLRNGRKGARSVSLHVPLWALILFEPEEAQRWSREVESHIWELLDQRALKQARHDRRKLIARGFLLAIMIRLTKRFDRAHRTANREEER